MFMPRYFLLSIGFHLKDIEFLEAKAYWLLTFYITRSTYDIEETVDGKPRKENISERQEKPVWGRRSGRLFSGGCTGNGGPPTHLRHANHYAINRFGKYYAHCKGLFVLGPGSCSCLLAYPSFVILFIFMILQRELIKSTFGNAEVILGFIVWSICFLSFLICSTSDPGVVPKDYSYAQLMEETTFRRVLFPGERYYRYCNKCGSLRPPRSYHCSICNICIRRPDVHAHIIGSCVGERNFRSFFCFHISMSTLSMYLLAIHCRIIADLVGMLISETPNVSTLQLTLSTISFLYGVIGVCYPNVGIFLLLYRIYLICVNRTCREEYRIFSDKSIDNPPYVKTLSKNIAEFLCPTFVGKSTFRRSTNVIDISGAWRDNSNSSGGHLPFLSMYNRKASNTVDESSLQENIINKNLAAHARTKSWSSLPQIVNGGLQIVPGMRIKIPKLARPSELLQKKIETFYKSRTMSKAEIAYRKQHKDPITLSDGCIPRTENTETELVTMARAAQIRAIIERVISRDRRGLVDLSRRINIGGLVGIDNFDPDDLQVIELNNGIPLVTRRNQNHLNQRGRRIGGAQHSSPQMVAAGFLPAAQHFILGSQAASHREISSEVHNHNENNPCLMRTVATMGTRALARRRQLFRINPNMTNENSIENFFGSAIVRHNPDVGRTESLRRNAVRNWNVQRYARNFMRDNLDNPNGGRIVPSRLNLGSLMDPLSDDYLDMENPGGGSSTLMTDLANNRLMTNTGSSRNPTASLDSGNNPEQHRRHFQQLAQNLLQASQRLRESLLQSQLLLELTDEQDQENNNEPQDEE